MDKAAHKEYKYSYKTQKRSASLFVSNVGLQKCTPRYMWGPGMRSHYLIHHVVAGRGSYTTEKNTYQLKAGDTFITFPGSIICYESDKEDPWEYFWVGFNGGDALFLLEQTDFAPAFPVISTDFGTHLKDLIYNIYTARGTGIVDTTRMTGCLYMLLAYLIEQSGSRHIEEESSHLYVRMAIDYIADNYARSITLEDLARHVDVSRSWLYKCFIGRVSLSPSKYLANFRINQACILLQNSDLPVSEIARSVGYEDPLYFSRAFKGAMGVCPREYRERVGE